MPASPQTSATHVCRQLMPSRPRVPIQAGTPLRPRRALETVSPVLKTRCLEARRPVSAVAPDRCMPQACPCKPPPPPTSRVAQRRQGRGRSPRQDAPRCVGVAGKPKARSRACSGRNQQMSRNEHTKAQVHECPSVLVAFTWSVACAKTTKDSEGVRWEAGS